MEKRVRNVNWENEEKALLKEIMKPFLSILENKCNETNTNKKKAKCWQDITEKFNSLNGRNRDLKQIVLQWKTMKLKSKKEVANFRSESKKTGGGPPPTLSNEAVEMMSLIPNEYVIDSNEYDSNADFGEPLEIEIHKPLGLEDCSDIQEKTDGLQLHEAGTSTSSAGIRVVQETPTKNIGSWVPSGEKKMRTKFSSPTTNQQEFNLKKETYLSMERFRALENERQESEHKMKLKYAHEQHTKILEMMNNQEKFAYEQHQQVMRILELKEKLILKQLETE